MPNTGWVISKTLFNIESGDQVNRVDPLTGRGKRANRFFVFIAPAPIVTWLERLHRGMSGIMVMSGRVLTRRAVTTADMPTGPANA